MTEKIYDSPIVLSNRKRTRILAGIGDLDRRLFSIGYDEKRGVQIFISTARFIHDPIRDFDVRDIFEKPCKEGRNFKISIHPSNGSSNYNVLTCNMDHVDGPPRRHSAVTSALKANDNFAFLLSKSVAWPDGQIIGPDKVVNGVKVGSIDPKRETLVYSLYACSPSYSVDLSPFANLCRVSTFLIGGVKIVLLVSSINLPSYWRSTTMSFVEMANYRSILDGRLDRDIEIMDAENVFDRINREIGDLSENFSPKDYKDYMTNAMSYNIFVSKYNFDVSHILEAILFSFEKEIGVKVPPEYILVRPVAVLNDNKVGPRK